MPTRTTPMVSCIMPTYGRPAFMGESVGMFVDQDYPNKELIILNDCAGQVYECDEPSVHVVNVDKRYATLGDKRNDCIKLAKGDIIAVWDDDDVYLPWRLSFSIQEMLRLDTPFYRPADFWAYWGQPELHDNQSVPYWVSHGSVLFTKALWSEVGGYPSVHMGEDVRFFERIHRTLGKTFITYPLHRSDRAFVMRGTSQYRHMSIAGGKRELETARGTHKIVPMPIEDATLREACNRLIAERAVRRPEILPIFWARG